MDNPQRGSVKKVLEMVVLVIVIAVIVIYILNQSRSTPSDTAQKAISSNLTVEQIENASFGPELMHVPGTFSNGSFLTSDCNTVPRKDGCLGASIQRTEGNKAWVIFGDLNDDGVSDAVAFLNLYCGGAGTCSTAMAAWLNEKGTPKFAGAYNLGYRSGVVKPAIVDGVISFDVVSNSASQTDRKAVRYGLRDNHLAQLTDQMLPAPSASGEVAWKTYSDESISFEYPSILTLSRDENGYFVLKHSIAFRHPNPCDFKGDAPDLERLTDFNATIIVSKKSVRQFVETSAYPDWDYISKNPYTVGAWRGYKVRLGIEGCGVDDYFFPVSSNKSLVVRRPIPTELEDITADYRANRSLPGVIVPDQADEFVSRIITSLKVK